MDVKWTGCSRLGRASVSVLHGPGTALITRAHLKGWLPSFQPPDAAEMARFDPPLGLRFPGRARRISR
jgi:hypothetical protein